MDSLLTQLAAIEPVDWIGMLSGIIGVILSIRERLSAWPFFILCYSAYVYISFRSGYYAFSTMNVVFVLVAVYGWCKWAGIIKGRGNAEKLSVSRLPKKSLMYVFGLIFAGTVIIGFALLQLDTERLPFLDAFAVSNALLAQWMLSRKYLENWLFWVISDIIYLALFFHDRLWPSVVLFGIFILLAGKGWHDWKQAMIISNVEH